jgi:hypothetical protein
LSFPPKDSLASGTKHEADQSLGQDTPWQRWGVSYVNIFSLFLYVMMIALGPNIYLSGDGVFLGMI